MSGELVLVLGGARSGKSRFAERLAREEGRALYVATAEPGDGEMRARIAEHRRRRPADWRTVEAPTGVATAVERAWRGEPAVILEDLALLTSNVLLSAVAAAEAPPAAAEAAEAALNDEADALLRWLDGQRRVRLIAVSQEAGLGVVPPTPLGRAFRDLLGRLNQRLGRRAAHVYLVVAGWAVDLRQVGRPVED